MVNDVQANNGIISTSSIDTQNSSDNFETSSNIENWSKSHQKFEDQLAVLIGEQAAGAVSVGMFNEKGFFCAVGAHDAPGSFEQSPKAKVPLSEVSKRPDAETVGNSQTDMEACPASSKKIDEIRAGFAPENKNGIGRVNPDLSVYTDRLRPAQNSVSNATVPAQISAESLVATTKINSAQSQVVPSNSRSIQSGGFGSTIDQSSKTNFAQHVQRSELLQHSSNLRLALQEVGNGIRLVAEIKDMGRAKRQEVRSQLLSLLAQHGMGNYELSLNGEVFSNLMTEEVEK